MIPEIWSATDNFFVILDHFCAFTPPPPNQPTRKTKILKMKKMHGDVEISLFYTNVPQIMICYTVPDIQ